MEEMVVGRAVRPGARRLLVELHDLYADEHDVQVAQVEKLFELCSAYAPDDATRVALPGQERPMPVGADGTPHVAEGLMLEVAPLLGMSPDAAMGMIALRMDVIHRLPLTWQAVKDRRLRVWQAEQIAHRASDLSAEAAGWLDERLAPALGRIPWPRVKRKLAGLVLRADAELAVRKAAQARAERYVRVRHNGDGTAFITARTDAVDALRFARMVDQVADYLALAGDTDEVDVRRATAVGVLADPQTAQALLAGPDPNGPPRTRRRPPTAELIVHLAPGQHVGRCEELGPVLSEQVRHWLGHHRVVVRPVVDLSDNPQVDSYEIPEPIRRIVAWRNPFDVFPYSARTAAGCDLDHTVPYRHGPGAPAGQTCPDNLGPVSRWPHNAKTHGGWQVSQPFPGTFEWRSPAGFTYRVDRTGSRLLTHVTAEPVTPTGNDGRGPRPSPVILDCIYPIRDINLDLTG